MPGKHLLTLSLIVGLLFSPTAACADGPRQDGPAPVITVTPGEIIQALLPNDTVTHTLTLTNPGATAATVRLDAQERGVTGLAASIAEDYRLLVITPRPHTGAEQLLGVLRTMDDLSFAFWDSVSGTPDVADLQPYDVVLVGNYYFWELGGMQPDALGDALADYIDLGGKVIDTQLLQANDALGLTGRYSSDGYAPVQAATAPNYTKGSYQVTVSDVSHPLMAGLGAMTTGAMLDVAPRAGAVVPAVIAGTATPFVAANSEVVFINQQLFSGVWGEGDLATLLRNAIHWLCGERTPWLTITPDAVQLAPGATQEVAVTLNSSDITPLRVYQADIRITDSAGALPDIIVPVELAVLNDLNMGRLSGVVTANRPEGPFEGVHVQAQPPSGKPRNDETDVKGGYRLWLTPGTYHVTVTLDGYLPHEADIVITPQGRSTHDIRLTCNAAWLRLSPERIVMIAPDLQEAQIELANDGIQPLTFELTKDLPPWASAAPARGEIAPGEKALIMLQFDPAAALPGWNVARLTLNDDPWQAPDALMLYLKTGHAVMLPALQAADAHPPDGQLD